MKMDKDVFKQLLNQHANGAFAMATSMTGCRSDAEDALQDACCAMLKNHSLPQDPHELKLIFYKAVRNKAIDRLRNKMAEVKCRVVTHDEEALNVPSQEPSPEREVSRCQQQQALLVALRKLTSDHRDIVLLKDWQQFSYAEIAVILDLEPGTVMSRLHRARLALRHHLQKIAEASYE